MELIITTREELSEVVAKAIEAAMNNKAVVVEVPIQKNKHYTIEELMDILPDKPAKQTVYGWVNNRKIPFKKIGSKLYFKKSEIEEWLDNGRQITLEMNLKP